MLIPLPVLTGIAAGKIRCAFRRWRRPTVKTGGSLRTAVGQLRIDRVAPVSLASISAQDARLAGYPSKAALRRALAAYDTGTLHRIDLHLEGPDPRIALRSQTALSAADIAALSARLARWDAASPFGPWTRRVLELIRAHPHESAARLAGRLELPKAWLKISVRKLKDLGLTVSHDPGYAVSPRGARLLAALAAVGPLPSAPPPDSAARRSTHDPASQAALRRARPTPSAAPPAR